MKSVFYQKHQVSDLQYGADTVFIVYIHLLSQLPAPQVPVTCHLSPFNPSPVQVFLVTFFTMFLTVGLATQFFQIDLIISAIHDNFWTRLNKYLKSREILSMVVVTLGFLLCLPLLSRSSLLLLQLAETHVALHRYRSQSMMTYLKQTDSKPGQPRVAGAGGAGGGAGLLRVAGHSKEYPGQV